MESSPRDVVVPALACAVAASTEATLVDDQSAPQNAQMRRWSADAMHGINTMPKETPKHRFRIHPMSATATNIIEERGRARKERRLEEFEKLTKEFRRQRKQDRKERVLEGLTKDLDIRDRWMGIRELKAKCKPIPFHNKDKDGKHIQWKDRAQKAADI